MKTTNKKSVTISMLPVLILLIPVISGGRIYGQQSTTTGTFNCNCSKHPYMTGKAIMQITAGH